MTSGIAPARPPRPRAKSIFKSLEAGVVVGDKYRLVRCLGEGGMATLWVAHNEALDIEVAIKFIRTDLTTPKLAERLVTEARAAAKRQAKQMDFIVANNPTAAGSGFGAVDHQVMLLGGEGVLWRSESLPKSALAAELLRRLADAAGKGSA